MRTGELIKAELKAKGIKQTFVAQKLNLSDSRFSEILNKELEIDLFLKICEIANLNESKIFEKYKNQLKEDSCQKSN